MIFPPIPPRLLFAGGALVVLLAGGWWYGHVRYSAGRADVQALWDADKAVVTTALLDAASRADAIRRADAATARKVQDELQAKLDAAAAGRDDLARRLRLYAARTCDRAVSGPASPPAGTTPAAPEPRSDSGIAAATAAVVSACESDSSLLLGWQDWYRGVAGNR
jgi:hypothetical protein